MANDDKKIIIARPYRALLDNRNNFLARGDLQIITVDTNSEILILHHKLIPDLIVTGFDVPGMNVLELCRTIRSNELLKKVSIIVISNKEAGQQEKCKECKANAFLTMDTAPQAFSEAARKLLNVAERASIRLPVSVKVDGKDKTGRPFLSFSENMSATGMLVESEKEMKIGDTVTCSFFLDDNTQIVTIAEVVRAVKKRVGQEVNQYGLRFCGLPGGVIDSMSAYIKSNQGAD